MEEVRRKAKIFIFAGIAVALVSVLVATWLSGNNPELLAQAESLIRQYGFFGVFFSTIIAGSVIPFGSPLIVAYAAAFGLNVFALALTAATGYTLGVLTSYIPAWLFGEEYVKKKMGEKNFQVYVETWNKYGYKLCAVLSFIPGFPVDLLAFVCGCFRTRVKWFLPLCWVSLLVQFLLCGYVGQWIGIYVLS